MREKSKMADTTKPTQETGVQSGNPQSAAAQKAPAQQSAADKTRDYESRTRQEGVGKMGDVGDVVDQAKQTVNDVYQQASRSVNETLGQAKEYSRENPGTATLVAFGVGVGVGVLLTSGVLSTGRSRSQRLVPPVMNALSEIAGELFRR
jgi:ElaB/YqjD/DUF883 family membrane-anchored ribosome-binding protein